MEQPQLPPQRTLPTQHIIPIQALLRELASDVRDKANEHIRVNIKSLPEAAQDAAYAELRRNLEQMRIAATTASPEGSTTRFAAPDSNGGFQVHSGAPNSAASSSSTKVRSRKRISDGDDMMDTTEGSDECKDDEATAAHGYESDADELALAATRKLLKAQEQKVKETEKRLALKKARKHQDDVDKSAKKRKAWLDGVGVMKLALKDNEFDTDEVGYGCPEDADTYVPVLKPTTEGVARLRELMRLPKTAIERAVEMMTTSIQLLEKHVPVYYNARYHYKRTKDQHARVEALKRAKAEARRADFDDKDDERVLLEVQRREDAAKAAAAAME